MLSTKDLPHRALSKSINLLRRGSLSVGPKILWWLHRQRFAVERRWTLVEINSRRGPGHCRTEKPSNLPRATKHDVAFAARALMVTGGAPRAIEVEGGR